MKFDLSEIKEKAFQEACIPRSLFLRWICDEESRILQHSVMLPIQERKNPDGCLRYSFRNSSLIHHGIIPWRHAFKKIHSVSVKEENIGGNCPVFHDENGKPSCPFKSVRNKGPTS